RPEFALIELVRNPCLTILGGSTLHWIKESIPTEAIGGGFTSRVIFVFRDKKEKLVPWPILTEENVKRADAIVHDLGEIAKMRGPFALNDKAMEIYTEEYIRFNRKSGLFDIPSLSGYANRRSTTLLKVAMVISASRTDSRVVDKFDMASAMSAMESVEVDMPRVLEAIKSEFIGDVCEEVLKLIMTRRTITRPQLIKAMRYRLSVRELDIVLETLLVIENKAGKNIVTAENDSGKVRYIYTGDKT
ncbi:unnamed protein product, partial [marine sediment metagenome]